MRPEELEQTMVSEEEEGVSGESAVAENASESAGQKSHRSKFIACALALLLAVGAGLWYLHAQGYESTDDAQIDGHINSVSSRIAGTIEKVYVEDNQLVQAGQPLVDMDTRELKIAAEQSGAQYAEALARLNSESPNVAIAQNTNEAEIAMAQSQMADSRAGLEAAEHDRQSAASRLDEAHATAKRDQLQADRYKQLFAKEETSRQEYENYMATAQASNARLAAAQAGLASAEKVVQQRKAQVESQAARAAEVAKNAPHTLAVRMASTQGQRASVDLAHAEQARAALNLSYTNIVSPVTGVVTERSAEPGNHIQQGEQLLMVVDTAHLWVTADFKETQLRSMHPGCKAEVKVDALGRTFEGVVESMPAITGARSSVLPPENATGNYVKVVQRLPVRIALTPGQTQLNLLRPGMSVEAKVALR
jgi:membrane fusion protein (multidrug efflux system)